MEARNFASSVDRRRNSVCGEGGGWAGVKGNCIFKVMSGWSEVMWSCTMSASLIFMCGVKRRE